MEHIDPRKQLNKEDFCELFEQVPLTDKEREDVATIYWGIYTKCVENPDATNCIGPP